MTGDAHAHALIVEDDLVSGLGVQHLLEELGFTSFAFAGTGAQAGEQSRLRRPDLLTVDVGLLDGDGLEACRAVEAACGPVPTVFITGQPERVSLQGAVVVEKPVRSEALAQAVRRARAAPALVAPR